MYVVTFHFTYHSSRIKTFFKAFHFTFLSRIKTNFESVSFYSHICHFHVSKQILTKSENKFLLGWGPRICYKFDLLVTFYVSKSNCNIP